jgi:hypothetical protein
MESLHPGPAAPSVRVPCSITFELDWTKRAERVAIIRNSYHGTSKGKKHNII